MRSSQVCDLRTSRIGLGLFDPKSKFRPKIGAVTPVFGSVLGSPGSTASAAEEGVFRFPPFRGVHDLPATYEDREAGYGG